MELSSLSRFSFLTLPDYSMIAVANAIEACRMANRIAGRAVYEWQVVTINGIAATASNGLTLMPTAQLQETTQTDVLFVCGGTHVRAAVNKPVLSMLRRRAGKGGFLGALCTGAFVLAEAGLLDDYKCAIHWENLVSCREEFKNTTFVPDLFVVDRNRITCTGGVAPLDMMLHLTEARLGRNFAEAVSAAFVHERVRPGAERQPLTGQYLNFSGPPILQKAMMLIEEDPAGDWSLAELARRLNISSRQLQRIFKQHMNCTLGRFVQDLRLKRAREVLQQMDLRIAEVAEMCGFSSPAYFSSVYSKFFGYSPRHEGHEARTRGLVD